MLSYKIINQLGLAFLLLGFMLLSCSAIQGRRAAAVKSVERTSSLDQLSERIANADSIAVYLLEEWVEDTSSAGFEGFKVEEIATVADSSEVASLNALFSDSTYYYSDTIVKRCDFSPRLGFRLNDAQSGTTTIMVATNCDMMEIKTDDGSERWDCTVEARQQFIALIEDVFPQ